MKREKLNLGEKVAVTSIFIQKGDRGFIYSKIMRIWRRKKVDDTVCVIDLMVSNIGLFATRC